MIERSVSALSQALAAKEISSVELTQLYLDRIKNLNPAINAYITVDAEKSLSQARLADDMRAAGNAKPLTGIPLAQKDIFCAKGCLTTCGSKILSNFVSPYDATVIDRFNAAGAVILGKTNMDEFAMGSSNETSYFGPVKNPWDMTRVPGGSSGGSAAAVAALLAPAATGTDTGGSVRQPAAFTGIIGMKPTYSRVSRWGLIAYASTFDTIGIFSKTVKDNALVMEIIAGHDEFDSTSSRKPVFHYSELLHFDKKVKVAYLKETIDSPALQAEIKENTLNVLAKLKTEGHDVEEVKFPLLKYLLPTYYILTTAEASSNLSRFDGVKYGYRSPNAHNLESMYKLTRSEGFGEEVKRRIMLGTFVLSASYYDAYFTKAQKVRRLIKDLTENLLNDYDYIIMPTTPTTAFKFGEHSGDPVAMYLEDLFTVQASVSGVPAISIPNGMDKAGMPIGLQVICNSFKEAELYGFSNYLTGLIS